MKNPSEQLVNDTHIKNILKTKNKFILELFKKYSGFNEINSIHNYLRNYEDRDYLKAYFKEQNISAKTCGLENLKTVNKNKGCIIVANHPLGGIDGLLLLDEVLNVRKDVKLMANFVLQRITPIKDFFIPVNPLEKYKNEKSSFSGLKQAIEFVNNGGCLIIFPAGQVSTFNKGKIQDREWIDSVIKLINKINAPVIPAFIGGNNSFLFHFMGLINPYLRTARLPKEMFNLKNVEIPINFGKAIFEKEKDIKKYKRKLWNATYELKFLN